MRTLWRLALALAPAGMLGAYASFPAMAFLPWVALVPWVVLYADDRNERPSYLYYGLGAYAAWILQYPQAWRFGWYAPFVMGFACILLWLPFAPLVVWLRRRVALPRALGVALAWTTVEWLRSTFTVSHFDLYGLGYSQARFPLLVQFSDVTGVYGVSFLIAAVNGWLADVWLASREDGFRETMFRRSISWSVILIVCTLAAVCGYGAWRLGTIEHVRGPRVAIVQPNLPHLKNNLVAVHLEQLAMTARRVPPREADLVIWPENAILDNIRREGTYLDDLGRLARDKGAWFLVGALGERADQPGYTTNGAWLIDTEGTIRGAYQKRVLFPWSEYIPGDRFLGRWLPGLQRFHRWITRLGWGSQPSGTAGQRTEIMTLPWGGGSTRFAPLICVENIYPPLPAEAGRLGARFFVNITSEGLVGGPVQEQLLRIAIFRGIENRMSYVRVGNTGISAVLDATGRVVMVLRGDSGNTINTAGTMLVDVPIANAGVSVYARSRDLFAKLVVALTVLLPAIFAFRSRRTARVAAPAMAVALTLLVVGCASPPSLDGGEKAVSANLLRGRASLAAGRNADAVEALAAACATETGCREAVPLLYEAYSRQKVDDVAVGAFGQISGRYPSLAAEAQAARGYFLERILELPEAAEAYGASIAARPTTLAWERLGRLYVRMDRIEDALVAFRQGLALEPTSTQLRYLLARAMFFSGRQDAAEPLLRDLVEEHPDHGNAWTLLAWIRLDSGDRAGAESYLRTALRQDPVPTEARYVDAKMRIRRDDWDGVEQIVRDLRAR